MTPILNGNAAAYASNLPEAHSTQQKHPNQMMGGIILVSPPDLPDAQLKIFQKQAAFTRTPQAPTATGNRSRRYSTLAQENVSESQAVVAKIVMNMYLPNQDVNALFHDAYIYFIEKINTLNLDTNEGQQTYKQFGFAIRQLIIVQQWLSLPNLKFLAINKIEQVSDHLEGQQFELFDLTKMSGVLDFLILESKIYYFSRPKIVESQLINEFFQASFSETNIDKILNHIAKLLQLYNLTPALREACAVNFQKLKIAIQDTTFLTNPVQFEDILISFLKASGEMVEKIKIIESLKSGIVETKTPIFNSTGLEVLNTINTPISAYFKNSPNEFYRGCMLAPTKGIGSLSNISKGFIYLPILQNFKVQNEAKLELHVMKKDPTLPSGFFCKTLRCTLDKEGLWYPLIKTKTSSETYIKDAEHNFAMLIECNKKYFPVNYELRDSHGTIQDISNLIIGVQIPTALLDSSKPGPKTCPVLLASTNMIKSLASNMRVATAVKQAIESNREAIEQYPAASSLIRNTPPPTQYRQAPTRTSSNTVVRPILQNSLSAVPQAPQRFLPLQSEFSPATHTTPLVQRPGPTLFNLSEAQPLEPLRQNHFDGQQEEAGQNEKETYPPKRKRVTSQNTPQKKQCLSVEDKGSAADKCNPVEIRNHSEQIENWVDQTRQSAQDIEIVIENEIETDNTIGHEIMSVFNNEREDLPPTANIEPPTPLDFLEEEIEIDLNIPLEDGFDD